MAKRRKVSRAEKAHTIAAVAERAIMNGKGTEDVLKAVRRVFPKAKTSTYCVGWYRSDLRKRGFKVPTPARAKGDA